MNKPSISLFSITEKPLETVALACQAWLNPSIPSTVAEAGWSEEYCIELFRNVLTEKHQAPLEYINTVWVLKGVSRAFQQQLTRHRVGFSYSIQSLRMVDVGNFADLGAYHTPSSVKDKAAYHAGMLRAQESYRYALARGEKTEDARGLLPLNVHSTITMACSYRSLVGLLKNRLCVQAQEEWREVAIQIKREMTLVHPVLAEPLDCFCGLHARKKAHCQVLKRVVTIEEYHAS